MAPEQALGDSDAVSFCSDVYAMGVILYELLTGKVPFEGPTTAVLVAVVKDAPAPPSSRRGDVDATLEGVCMKALAKLPAQRYAGMAELAAVLDDYLEGRAVDVPSALTPAETALETILREFRAVGYERGRARALAGLARLEGLAEQGREALSAWLREEEGAWQQAQKRFARVRGIAPLSAWAELGQACATIRRFHFPKALLQRLERAAALAAPSDQRLQGEIAYVRASVLARQGGWEEAALALHQALEHLGRDHPLMGAVLDLLGRVYGGKCNFRAACEFFQQAIAFKIERDDPGLAYSHEELGWLYVDYGQLDRAEEELTAGLHVAQRRGDELAEARLINHAGRVALARADREIEANNLPAARKWREKAQEDLDWAARVYQRTGQDVPEGRLRKYLAMIAIGDGDLAAAEKHLERGKELLGNAGHAPGLAEVQEYTAYLRLAQNRAEEAATLLRQALAEYDRLRLALAGARTQHQLARTLARIRVPKGQVIRAYEEALRRAEACRRGDLVAQLERELGGIDPELVSKHLFRRVRGHGAPEGVSSLNEGSSDAATVLCLELVDFEGFCQGLDPAAVMWTLNQLLADLQGILDRHKAQVLTYLGGGFMALLRETGHAERAVEAALELRETMADFNRPRDALDLPLLPARIGVATGLVFLGNIGTYRHLDFAAVGPPVNLAASLMRRADPASPTISQETYEAVRDRFLYTPQSPRRVDVTGIGSRQVWDVTGRGTRPGSGRSIR
jgi:class 3 adenylate cyclase